MVYSAHPLRPGYGAAVEGFDLGSEELSDALRERLWTDVVEHRLLLFRGQSLTPERLVQIASAFGEVVEWGEHPATPHPAIYPVSNDDSRGFVGNGTTGFHNDGVSRWHPPKLCLLYCVANVEGGDTLFAPAEEMLQEQDKETRGAWKRLWAVHHNDADEDDTLFTPLVYEHPHSGRETMLFHTGTFGNARLIDCWCVDADPAEVRPGEPVIEQLQAAAEAAVGRSGLSLRLMPGDLLLHDNLAHVHMASGGTQVPASEGGLRLLHRVVVAGDRLPTKSCGRGSFWAAKPPHAR